MDILSYSEREWKGNTAKSALIRKVGVRAAARKKCSDLKPVVVVFHINGSKTSCGVCLCAAAGL